MRATAWSRSRSDRTAVAIQPVFVVEPPRLVVPPVEREQVGVQRRGVSDVVFGGQRHPGGEQHALRDALLGEQTQARFPFDVFGAHRLGLVGLVGIARSHLLEHLLQRAWLVGVIEAQPLLAVERGDAVPGQHHLVARSVADRGDGAVVELLRQVAGEGVTRFVAVRVAIEDLVVQSTHGSTSPHPDQYNNTDDSPPAILPVTPSLRPCQPAVGCPSRHAKHPRPATPRRQRCRLDRRSSARPGSSRTTPRTSGSRR